MPDVFVPLDTLEYTDYYRDLLAKGIINRFVISHVDNNRKLILKKYKTVKDFDCGFIVDDSLMDELKKLGEADSVKFNEEQYEKSKELLKSVTKALIARDVYTDPGAFYVVSNHRNPIFKKALEIINDDKIYYGTLEK